MDAEAWTIVGVIAGNVLAFAALIVSVLSWRASHRAAKANEDMAVSNRRMAEANERMTATNERMADSAEQSARTAADALGIERAARQEALRAHFRLRGGPFWAGLGGRNSVGLKARNIGPRTAENVRLGIALPGEDIDVGQQGRPIDVGQEVDYSFERSFRGMEMIFHVLLVYDDGAGEHRQTFTVRYYRQGEGPWQFDMVTETTPAAP